METSGSEMRLQQDRLQAATVVLCQPWKRLTLGGIQLFFSSPLVALQKKFKPPVPVTPIPAEVEKREREKDRLVRHRAGMG